MNVTFSIAVSVLFLEHIVRLLDRWLAKDEDDGLIERELPAEKEGQPAIPLLTYKIQVVTGKSQQQSNIFFLNY